MKDRCEMMKAYQEGHITLAELQEWRDKLEKAYEAGQITRMEYRARMIEWSTEENGRKFYYKCPRCGNPMSHCPDPCCQEEGVGHHLFKEDWEGCDEDIRYTDAKKVYRDELITVQMGSFIRRPV